MASDVPCGGDAWESMPYIDDDGAAYETTYSEGCQGCAKSAANGGKCGGGGGVGDT